MSLHQQNLVQRCVTGADPERFFRGGSTLTSLFFVVDKGREDPNTTICGPSPARQRNAI